TGVQTCALPISKRSNHSVPRQKVAQQLQPAVLALLRMKLDGKDVALAESRGELDAVARTACRLRLVGKCHVITVDEVETAAIVDALPQRVILHLLHYVPAHVGHLEAGTVRIEERLRGRRGAWLSETAH